VISSTIINFTNPSTPDDPYWLTIEVEEFDNRATLEDAAVAADTLYDLDPCIGEQEVQEEEPTPEDLQRVAAAIDLDLCESLLSGDYETVVKIIRSHPNIPYSVVLTVGVVTQTVVHNEPVILTLDIKEASSIVLPYPVVSGITASWLGNVYNKIGNIAAPTINSIHNVLFWNSSVTGTLKVQYNSTWDELVIAVPGVKENEDDVRGEKQGSDIIVFYHYQTYSESITAPPDDPALDDPSFLSEICGWGNSTTFGGDDEDEQPIAEPPEPEDPCLDHDNELADPDYYEETCCNPPPFGLSDCKEWIVGAVSSKSLDQSTMEQYIAGHDGPVEFIAVGPHPDDKEGCGRIIHKLNVSSKNCCDDIPPLVAHPNNPTEISSNSSVVMCVLGGGPILTWEAGGGLYFHDVYGSHVNKIETGNSDPTCVTVYAPKDFCEDSKVQVEDECTDVSMNLHKPDATPLVLCDDDHQDIVIAPNSYYDFSSLVSGGSPPYTGWSSDKLQHIANGLFKAPDDFCGTATVNVMDSCMEEAECTVRSTEGYWDIILDFDHCSLPVSRLLVPETPMSVETYSGVFVGGGYKAMIGHALAGWNSSCSEAEALLACPVGNVLTTHSNAFWTNYCMNHGYASYCGYAKEFSDGCCKNDSSGTNQCTTAPNWYYFAAGDQVINLSKWRCS